MSTQDAGPNEVYCSSCGEIIKEEAEICPECGVRQKEPDTGQDIDDKVDEVLEGDITDKKLAQKNMRAVMAWSFFVTPVGYLKVGKTGLALINLLTANFLLLGPLIVPFHTQKMIKDARKRVRSE